MAVAKFLDSDVPTLAPFWAPWVSNDPVGNATWLSIPDGGYCVVMLSATVTVEDTAIVRGKVSHGMDVYTDRAIKDHFSCVRNSINFGYSRYHWSWVEFAGTLSLKVGVRDTRLGTIHFYVFKSVWNPATVTAKACLCAIDDLLLG